MIIISKTTDLMVLLAVFDCGSFSGAAKQLDMPVAKVSRAIQRLEHEHNCNLFNRTTRKVKPTEEGRAFVEQVRLSLTQLEQAEENLRLLQSTPSGLLRVDAVTPFILHQLIPLMNDFKKQYPLITLELISSENIIDLLEKRTDIAIRIGQLQDSNLHATKLGLSKLRMLASPQYLEKQSTPTQIKDLSHHTILGFSDNRKLNDWPLSENVILRPTIFASSGETLLQLCIQGYGIGLFSDFMTRQAIERGQLIEVLPNTILSSNPRELVQAVYYRNTTLASRISAFIEFIRDRLVL